MSNGSDDPFDMLGAGAAIPGFAQTAVASTLCLLLHDKNPLHREAVSKFLLHGEKELMTPSALLRQSHGVGKSYVLGGKSSVGVRRFQLA